MASSKRDSVTEPAIIEQVITEFFAKSLHIILESRSPYVSSRNYSGDPFISSPSPSHSSSSSSSSGRPRDKWFNLALRDCPAALENFDIWRQSNLEPLVVDVILIRRPEALNTAGPYSGACLGHNLSSPIGHNLTSSGHDDLIRGTKTEKIVERWIVQYEGRNSNSNSSSSSSSNSKEFFSGRVKSSSLSSQSSEIQSLYKKTYKRSIVLLRSLYATVRLLPAYKVFRVLNSSGKIRPFSLSHRISSFIEPFSRREDAEMSQFSFSPIDTPCGRLSLSVSYLSELEDVCPEPSTPISTELITDYVGSPATTPLMRFQSLPSAGIVVASPSPYVSFERRHSWSNDHGVTPPAFPSPSPTYSDSRALDCHPNHCMPPRSSRNEQSSSTCPVSRDALVARKYNTSFDDYWGSPAFSPSSSPSPSTHISSGQLTKAIFRSESAPVNIPLAKVGMISGLPNQGLPPSPSSKVSKPKCSQDDLLRAQVNTFSTSWTSSLESKPQMKKESSREGDFQTGITLHKLLSLRTDDVGNLSRLCGSPRITFSRSSSRLSLLDEFDDSEFACPFAVDDEDFPDSSNRSKAHECLNPESGGLQLVKRSPDAVVGSLVRLFKTAAPLEQDLLGSLRPSQPSKDELWNKRIPQDEGMDSGGRKPDNDASSVGTGASGLFRSRTAADALEELRSYQDTKHLLMGHGGSQSADAAATTAKYAVGSET